MNWYINIDVFNLPWMLAMISHSVSDINDNDVRLVKEALMPHDDFDKIRLVVRTFSYLKNPIV